MNLNYKKHLKNPAWFRKRKSVMKRDSDRCTNCGSNKELIVHHRQYHKNRISGKPVNAWDYNLKYLITLCRDCHLEGHKKFKIKFK